MKVDEKFNTILTDNRSMKSGVTDVSGFSDTLVKKKVKKVEKPKKDPKEISYHNEKFNTEFNGTPRKMPGGDKQDEWVIPFSACFVMKKADNFDTANCSIDVAFTCILRIKFTKLRY